LGVGLGMLIWSQLSPWLRKVIPPPVDRWLQYVLGFGWLVAFAVLTCRLCYFRCPRCRKTFFMRLLWTNAFARRCLHCSLSKWAEKNAEDDISLLP
jgi:hypothetical protein